MALAKLATTAAAVMAILLAVGINSEFATIRKKVLMRRVGGQIESLDERGQLEL